VTLPPAVPAVAVVRAPAAEGILVVDKPVGPTSFDVVHKLRKAMGTTEIGHCGTLDPLASGVVVVCVGRYTKLVRFLTADDKHYTAQVTFGHSTPSFDSETPADAFGDVNVVDADKIRAYCAGVRGTILQKPPVHSAVQKDGVRLYEKARRGEAVDVDARAVVAHAVELVDYTAPTATLSVSVGKGFFVRSLANDLGVALGCPAHLSGLRRTQSGAYSLDDAVALDDARDPERGRAGVLSGRKAVRGMRVLDVDDAIVADLRQGRRPKAPSNAEGTNLLACRGDEIVAVVDVVAAEGQDARLHIVRGF
jgi:tRNA pseudouridine55 synthase